MRDDELVPFVTQTLDARNPRKWYSALMDYGTMLKKEHPNPSRKSAQYYRQTPFKGSNREVRGQILKMLVVHPMTEKELLQKLRLNNRTMSCIQENIQQLQKEGFIRKKGTRLAIA